MKFKRYCELSISSLIYINKIKIFNLDEILIKLLIEYYNYTTIYDKIKIDKLLLYRFYNYKMEFVKEVDKNILSKSRIYLGLNYKLK